MAVEEPIASRTPVASRTYDRLPVHIYAGADSAGRAAARAALQILREAIRQRGEANVILATGNSQLSLMAAFREATDVRWSAVRVFHMDEYLGVPGTHPASFVRYMRDQLVDAVQPLAFFPIRGDGQDPEEECRRYEALLRQYPADLCCLGIGENGHLAFNEPGAADFHDSRWVRVITLDERSRRQQVGEGHFPHLDAVPRQAITLTIPALLSARRVIVTAPEARKAQAVREALLGPVSNACPASILRTCDHAELFLDRDSAALL